MSANGQSFMLLSSTVQENNSFYNQSDGDDFSAEDEQGDSYSCKVCFDEFRTLIELQRHYIKHIVNKPFQCQKCEKSYFKAAALQKHSKSHSVLKTYPCEHCDDRFPNKSKLDAHVDTHYFPKFSCNACFAYFPDQGKLHGHERSHTSQQENGLLYICFLCDSQFFFQYELEDHMDEHERIQLYICECCDKSFFFSYLLWKHKQDHIYKVHCNVCAESFSDKNRLHEHEKLHVREQLDSNSVICYVCELCNAIFPFKRELEIHYNDNHEGKNRFPCLMCYKTFFFDFLCVKHKATHNELNDYQCDQCSKKFRNLSGLKSHLILHGEKLLACPICEKKFALKRHLQLHSAVHTNLKPYGCSFCAAKFSSKANLQRHYTLHMKEKEKKCEKCDLYFTRLDGLNQHKKRHHLAVKCNVCNKTFLSQLKLTQHNKKEHLKTNTVYSCNLCEKTMKTYCSYLIHRKRHSGERPFKCDACGKAFYQKPHLLKHYKFQHPDFDVDLPFKCAYCTQACCLKRGLAMHIKKRHPKFEFKMR